MLKTALRVQKINRKTYKSTINHWKSSFRKETKTINQKRSAFITLVQAFIKSFTNFSLLSSWA